MMPENNFQLAVYIFLSIFILLLGSAALFLKPKVPYRHKKKSLFVYFLVCLWTVHAVNADGIFWEENITSLEQQQGILEHIEVRKGQHGGYFLYSQDGKKRLQLTLLLCPPLNLDSYLQQEVLVWHKRGYVYQISVGGEIIASLEECNRNIFFVNTYNLLFTILIFVFMLTPYYAIVREFCDIPDRRCTSNHCFHVLRL